MLEAYDFTGIDTLADIGGGNGSLLIGTLKRYPELKGLLFDLGHVADRAEEAIPRAGLADRCGVQRGSFFDALPQGAGAYLFRHMIHDWSDERRSRSSATAARPFRPTGGCWSWSPAYPRATNPPPQKTWTFRCSSTPAGWNAPRTRTGPVPRSGFRTQQRHADAIAGQPDRGPADLIRPCWNVRPDPHL